jgi:hypothetical protein
LSFRVTENKTIRKFFSRFKWLTCYPESRSRHVQGYSMLNQHLAVTFQSCFAFYWLHTTSPKQQRFLHTFSAALATNTQASVFGGTYLLSTSCKSVSMLLIFSSSFWWLLVIKSQSRMCDKMARCLYSILWTSSRIKFRLTLSLFN